MNERNDRRVEGTKGRKGKRARRGGNIMRAVYRGTSELLLQNLPAYLHSPRRAQTEINCVLARATMKRRCASAVLSATPEIKDALGQSLSEASPSKFHFGQFD